MNDTLFHRGPDGEGFHLDKNLALGHRRLAILDLVTGDQPMYSRDKNIILVFNGEIYNFIELKEELESLGCKFSTTSDTEVIINAYLTWGINCQNRFNGMWAFALWDESKKRLFISRDRIGEKPLYYTNHDNTFIFGSEIKAILAYGVPSIPRTELTELYLSLSFVPAPFTFYQNIYQLEPGKFLLVTPEGVKEDRYWALPDIREKDLITDKKFIEQEFETIFEDAVKIRMRSDAPYGAFLSGGLDSSSVVSMMSKHSLNPIQTFTMGFENEQFDERGLAKIIAEKFGTTHHEGVLTSENFSETLEKILFHYDEPFGDASAIPTGQISRYAAEFVKMVLTGDGGDEVLSGYSTYQGEMFVARYQNLSKSIRSNLPKVSQKLAKSFRGSARYKLNRITRVLEASNQPFEKRLLYKLCQTSPENLKSIISKDISTISFTDYLSDVFKPCKFQDPFYKLMYFHHTVTLPGDMLTKVDRMSMANSLETRIPFLDYRLVELLYKADKTLKTNFTKNKLILRNTIANKTLPIEVLKQGKKGFSVPLRDWFKEDNVGNLIKEVLISKNDNSILDGSLMERMIQENATSKNDWGNFIWIVLVLKFWMDQNRQIK